MWRQREGLARTTGIGECPLVGDGLDYDLVIAVLVVGCAPATFAILYFSCCRRLLELSLVSSSLELSLFRQPGELMAATNAMNILCTL